MVIFTFLENQKFFFNHGKKVAIVIYYTKKLYWIICIIFRIRASASAGLRVSRASSK